MPLLEGTLLVHSLINSKHLLVSLAFLFLQILGLTISLSRKQLLEKFQPLLFVIPTHQCDMLTLVFLLITRESTALAIFSGC
ncbi:hypothetical protein REPUB_Repub09cG0040400 [Reevesia pubescens]